MSTNKSQNLKLHLWEPEDDFLRTEFNENFAAIDTAVKSAQSAAAAAQNTADTAYVTGSYTGNGDKVEINLGFRPSFVIAVSMQSSFLASDSHQWTRYFGIVGRASSLGQITLTSTGFIANSSIFPDLAHNGRVYDYIAFR